MKNNPLTGSYLNTKINKIPPTICCCCTKKGSFLTSVNMKPHMKRFTYLDSIVAIRKFSDLSCIQIIPTDNRLCPVCAALLEQFYNNFQKYQSSLFSLKERCPNIFFPKVDIVNPQPKKQEESKNNVEESKSSEVELHIISSVGWTTGSEVLPEDFEKLDVDKFAKILRLHCPTICQILRKDENGVPIITASDVTALSILAFKRNKTFNLLQKALGIILFPNTTLEVN